VVLLWLVAHYHKMLFGRIDNAVCNISDQEKHLEYRHAFVKVLEKLCLAMKCDGERKLQFSQAQH